MKPRAKFVCANMSDAFTIHNGLKQGDAYHHCFTTSVQNVIMKVQENKKELELNGALTLMVYADEINLLDKCMNMIS